MSSPTPSCLFFPFSSHKIHIHKAHYKDKICALDIIERYLLKLIKLKSSCSCFSLYRCNLILFSYVCHKQSACKCDTSVKNFLLPLLFSYVWELWLQSLFFRGRGFMELYKKLSLLREGRKS